MRDRELRAAALAALACAACSSHDAGPPPKRDAAATAIAVGTATADLAARPLGAATADAFAWRARAGQPAFRAAQAAEASGAWPTAVAECETALAADPTHLDAAWLLAIAYAKTGALAKVADPLARAVAGDFGKWASASLDHPALREFLATPTGAAWQRRVAADRATYLAALARSIVVTVAGDLFAFDPSAPRWYRLSRTNGHVIGSFQAGRHLAFVTRGKGRVSVGAIDLDAGTSTHPVALTNANAPTTIVALADGMWIGQGAVAHLLAFDGSVTTAKLPRPNGPALTISAAGHARVARLPIASITGDWDDQGTASAIRIATTGRVVSVPSPGVIAGNTIAWSPDRTRLAFVAQLVDQCTPGSATVGAFVADAATAAIHELARGSGGLAIEWPDDRQLAIASGSGVELIAADDSAPHVAIVGATGLADPSFKARCAPLEPVAETGSGSDDEDAP
jgi:hypothetical protein